MEALTIKNPRSRDTTVFHLPTDSVVYIGYRADSFPGVYFPVPSLNWQGDIEKKQFWTNNVFPINANGVPTLTYCHGVMPVDVWNHVFFRVWTGCEPFDANFSVTVNGFTRDGGGTVTRKTYQRDNGEIYFVDSFSQNAVEQSMPWKKIVYDTNPIVIDNYLETTSTIYRDSEGNIIGGSSELLHHNETRKVGKRVIQVAVSITAPETVTGVRPTDGTQVGEAETVEVTDGFFVPAEPITFNLRLVVREKSYSIIQGA